MTQLERANDLSVEPFLKWAGGKRWLVHNARQAIPTSYNRYIEPFVGSAAMFFSESCGDFLIADTNPELINCYQSIKDNWKSVLKALKRHQHKHSDEYYYSVRSSKPWAAHTRAARFIYLNRTCWNGLYRVNLKGEFNVPRGTKNSVIFDTDDFAAVSSRLQSGEILCQDFERTIVHAGPGDFVFIDPPYTVKHNLNGFVKYNEKIFSWEDQERLKRCALEAANRGAMVTITNADHESIHSLYDGVGEIVQLRRPSIIAGKSKFRGETSEVVIRIGWSPDEQS